MTLTVRIDVDYAPWDTAARGRAGHAAPAVFLRLLALARREGWKLHVFLSRRSFRALPAFLDASLGEGHDVDVHFPTASRAVAEASGAVSEFRRALHEIVGCAVTGPWDTDGWPERFEFVAASEGRGLRGPVFTPDDPRHRQIVAPLLGLAQHDPRLDALATAVRAGLAEGRLIRTLREIRAGATG